MDRSIGAGPFSPWIRVELYCRLFHYRMQPFLPIEAAFPIELGGDFLPLSVAILPFAVPQSGEIYFTITNLQWFLSPVLAFLVVDLATGIDSPIRRLSVLILALTGPFGVLLSPLAGVSWFTHRQSRIQPMLPYLAGCAMQLIAYVTTHDQETAPSISHYALAKDFSTTAIGEVFVPCSVDFFYQHQGACIVVMCGLLALALLNGIRTARLSIVLVVAAAVLWTIGITRQGTPNMLGAIKSEVQHLPRVRCAHAKKKNVSTASA
jgi:hypothetical protein